MLPSLMSTGVSVQEKKRRIDFKDGGHNGHLEFLIGTISGIFELQVKYQVNWPFGSGEEAKIDFQESGNGRHLRFPIGTIITICDLQVTRTPDASYQASCQLACLFRRRSEKNRFSR